MTAEQLLAWLRAQNTPPTVEQLLVFHASGLTDLGLFLTSVNLLTGEAAEEMALLTKHGTSILEDPLTIWDIEAIARVGHQVYLRDRDNLAEWVSLATLIDRTDRAGWRPAPGSKIRWGQWEGNGPTRRFFAALLDAGRGPTYGRQLVRAAAERHLSPDTYTFTETLTASTFANLAEAGVGGPELDRMLAEGIKLEDVIELVGQKCPPGALIAAKNLGIPREKWLAMTTRLNPTWFPIFDGHPGRPMDPVRQGALDRQKFTWQQLRTLADNGWDDVQMPDLLGVWYGGRGAKVMFTPQLAVEIAKSGVKRDELARWLAELTQRNSAGSAPLLNRHNQPDVMNWVRLILDLRGSGVTPSSLVDYRHCGCTSIEDVFTAARAGITAGRVRQLRNDHGTVGRHERSKRIPNLDLLLDIHRRSTPAAGRRPRARA